MKTLLSVAAILSTLTAANAQARDIIAERRIPAEHARQGVASDGSNVYAIDNSDITRIRLTDGAVTGEWHGDPKIFPHLNSCTVVAAELVCASSNYPALPQLSTVEVFDLATLEHVRSISLGAMPGSLTVLDRHDEAWWAVFANYDNRATPAGRDHRDSFVAKLDDDFRILRMWGLPDEVLERLAPSSISGGSWDDAGHLYLSGHDKPEIYVMQLPRAGGLLDLVATLPIASRGQAIDVDPSDPTLLWSIDRGTRTIIGSRVPSLSD